MAVTAMSFRWLDLLEKEFDKAYVDLDILIGKPLNKVHAKLLFRFEGVLIPELHVCLVCCVYYSVFLPITLNKWMYTIEFNQKSETMCTGLL